MATTYHTAIQKLYVAYFNRPADVDGLNYWEGVVEAAKGDTAAVSAEFAKSAEYKAAFAGMNEKAAVTQVYKNLFGTTPDTAGLNYWATLLADGKITIDNVVTQIAGGALGADKTTYDNKVSAAVAFTNELDTPAEQLAYAKPGAAAAAKAFISSISTPASLTAAMVPATLKATVAAVVDAANVGQTFKLTATQDNLVGTDGNDTFKATIFDNQNTLQSGDAINGGAGVDRLEADVGNSQAFAITPETTGIEIAAFRAQTIARDGSDNNNAAEQVQIDAQRMVGVTQWESNNSRADLIIEDVRILDSQITKDITIAMVETDPGDVDYAVYFDQYSLRSQSTSQNVLRLQLLDTRSASENKAPLLESPYNGFAFFYNGVLKTVQSAAIDAATTYAQLLTAVTDAVKNAGLTNITVSAGGTFNVTDQLGKPVSGTEILLSSTVPGDIINATGAGAGWLAAGAVPPSSGLHTHMTTEGSTTPGLVTSKIILDDVGRGSMGGDLVVGGLSSGATSTSKGVESFEIEVRDNSKLQVVSSTANTLREVTIINGKTSSSSSAYVEVKKDKGDLTIAGSLDRDSTAGISARLPGTEAEHTSGYGLTDVRLVNATQMTGNLDLNAGITKAALAKYLNLKDTAVNAAADNVKVDYLGGVGNDKISLTIAGDVAGSTNISNTNVAREDFTFNIDGGAGNDTITVQVIDSGVAGATQNWYTNQQLLNNITVSGGAGDDTIKTPGAGNFIIDGGEGNDTIYTDNTGKGAATTINEGRATFVFNVADGGTAAGNQYNFFDLKSNGAATAINAVNANLTVSFKGITKMVNIANSLNATQNVAINDMHVNQAIKEAINLDPVLSKLLVAEDGPARSLIVRSLIDGQMVDGKTGSLIVTFGSSALSATQQGMSTPPVRFDHAAVNSGALGTAYTANFAQLAGGNSAVTAATEVQTLDIAGLSVAAAGTLVFVVDGTSFTYTNNTAAPLTGAALLNDIATGAGVGGTAVAITNYGVTVDAGLLRIEQNAGFEKSIVAITAGGVNGVEVRDGATALAAAGQANGGNSTTTSDNTITGGAGNDVIVLGTTVGTGIQASSNEIVKFAGNFGNDTIVNFAVTGDGIDKLDFTSLGGSGTATNAISNVAKSITIMGEITGTATGANDTIDKVVALYLASGDNTVATTHVFVAVDANNVGKVYAIVDGTGLAAGNISATLVGSIDLADTTWGSLVGAPGVFV